MVIRRTFGIVVLMLLVLCAVAFAHEEADEQPVQNGTNHAVELKQQALWLIIFGGAITAVFVVIALLYDHQKKKERTKWMLFLGIAVPVIVVTLYSAGTTIYLNESSITGGPVHWHADFELWKCGEKIDMKDPTGLSNRIGTPVFHEHGDDRVHVEGVVIKMEDVSLHHFFEFVGGQLSNEKMVVPVNDGFVSAYDGDLCDGGLGKLQAFLYRVKNPEQKGEWAYEQQKLTDFEDYVLSPYSNVPPGDCVVIEFDIEKERTDKLCSTYRFAQQRGELHGG